MQLKQLICFSWNENNKKKGYHVFARSSGLEELDVNTIIERLAYLPPKAMTAQTLEKLAETSRLLGYPTRGDSGLHFTVQREIDALFPTDCAFFILPSGDCCCAKVTYCGVDYRLSVWGNYIIHAYIFPYSRKFSPAWVLMSQKFKTKILPRELLACETQRPLPAIEIEDGENDLAALGEAVKAKGASLLAAIIDSVFAAAHEDMDIYINGTEDEILFWMHACQSLLPSELVTLMSFSTCRFSDDDASPFRIKRIVKKLGSARSYKLSAEDTAWIPIDPKNKIFSEKIPRLKLSGLMTYLLLNDPAEAIVLRDLIGTYIETKGVVDSDDICLIYRLARTDIYDDISELELCEALGGVVLGTFGKSTLDSVVEKYLNFTSDRAVKVSLYGLLASYHSNPEKIMDALFRRVLGDLARGRISPRDALDMLTEENFGRSTFAHVLRDLSENRAVFENAMADPSTRNFVFRLLFTGFYDLSESSSADLLVELIPYAIKYDNMQGRDFPLCISEMIDIVEFDEITYRRVIYAYYDYCRISGEFEPWCKLVALLFEQGRKLSSEAGLCAFIMRELDYGMLIGYMKKGAREAACILSLLAALRRFGAISERAHSNFVYAKFGEFLSQSSDQIVISYVIASVKNENDRLIEVLSHYANSTDKRLVFDIYKKEIGDLKASDREFLTEVYSSDAKYIATALVASKLSVKDEFISYLRFWYAGGFYRKCFPKAFSRLMRVIEENEAWSFLTLVFSICKDQFASSRRADFELWAGLFSERIENYIGKENELKSILLEMKRVSLSCGARLPYACETLLCTEAALSAKGDISMSLAKEFTQKASENLRDVYIRAYGARLLALCVSDMDVETISAAVWLSIVSSDRENLKKLIKGAARQSSASLRILLGRVTDALIIKEDPDKVEEIIISLAKNMKVSDYVSFKNKTLSKYDWDDYGGIFVLAEEKFGVLAKKRLEKSE